MGDYKYSYSNIKFGIKMEVFMKAFKIFACCVFLISATTFMGCSSRSKMVPNLALETDLSRYPICFFSVESQVTEDMDKELNELKSGILQRMSELNIFRSIQFARACEKSEGCLHVKVTITETKKVSGSKRLALGYLAGRAKMKAEITLIDATTQETIGSYTVTGESGNTDFSGGTGEAIRKASEAIVEVIQENYSSWR
jgi:hypothetical protein